MELEGCDRCRSTDRRGEAAQGFLTCVPPQARPRDRETENGARSPKRRGGFRPTGPVMSGALEFGRNDFGRRLESASANASATTPALARATPSRTRRDHEVISPWHKHLWLVDSGQGRDNDQL
jgi:hypothetical protein